MTIDHARFSLSWVEAVLAQRRERVARDHQFLVGRNDIARDPRCLARDQRLALAHWPRDRARRPARRAAAPRASRMAGAFSPMPAVKTKPSMPPIAAASMPVAERDPVDEIIERAAWRADPALASNSRTSLLMPDRPLRPHRCRESARSLRRSCPSRSGDRARRRDRAGRAACPWADRRAP